MTKIQASIPQSGINCKGTFTGHTGPVWALVDSYDSESFTYSLRNYMFAPDDVDSSIIATCPFENEIGLGDIVKVKIIDATAYELFGEIVEV